MRLPVVEIGDPEAQDGVLADAFHALDLQPDPDRPVVRLVETLTDDQPAPPHRTAGFPGLRVGARGRDHLLDPVSPCAEFLSVVGDVSG
ncbi:MAG TPA: hypothetical protein VIL71_23010 [Spirillospora sp.]